ncbi:hypothetical protein ACQB6R_02815 [Propionibacteriaceae bacterium G1746]|uniref:hypothetical protein n=1 Tax=Aestuariimicrobium sp. G57 TaxID=3418485 RepID=UPI003C1C1067
MTQDASFTSLMEHLARAQATMRVNREQQGEVPTGDVEGNDPTGTVTAQLDASGRLVGLRVADDWLSDLQDADGLATALTAAAADAQMRRFGLSSAPVDKVPKSVDEINRILDEAGDKAERSVEVTAADREAVDQHVAGFVQQLERAVATKTLEEAREDFKKQMDRLNAIEVQAPSATTTDYSNASRTLTLKFANGMLAGAEAKQVWAAKQSGKSLTMQLSEILGDVAH